jgi:hypothetical protein
MKKQLISREAITQKKLKREIIRKIKTNYLLVYNLDTGYIKSYFSLS